MLTLLGRIASKEIRWSKELTSVVPTELQWMCWCLSTDWRVLRTVQIKKSNPHLKLRIPTDWFSESQWNPSRQCLKAHVFIDWSSLVFRLIFSITSWRAFLILTVSHLTRISRSMRFNLTSHLLSTLYSLFSASLASSITRIQSVNSWNSFNRSSILDVPIESLYILSWTLISINSVSITNNNNNSSSKDDDDENSADEQKTISICPTISARFSFSGKRDERRSPIKFQSTRKGDVINTRRTTLVY